jgi:hypothetical protein
MPVIISHPPRNERDRAAETARHMLAHPARYDWKHARLVPEYPEPVFALARQFLRMLDVSE